MASIAEEVAQLAADGFREVTLLGQNVNSYADGSVESGELAAPPPMREGFRPMVPPPKASIRFAGLLEQLAVAHPEMRFRFTSPHPKDFPDDLLGVIQALPNACASLHIPAQSGSSSVLESMRRGYTRETYLTLIERVRELLPHVAISSDFISGFCGETEEDHQQTLSLLRAVQFDKAFMFAYSMREKTHAHRRLSDDVPEEIKQRRLSEVIQAFNEGARAAMEAEVGRHHLVLLEGPAKKPRPDGAVEWVGRTDTDKRVVLEYLPLPNKGALPNTAHQQSLDSLDRASGAAEGEGAKAEESAKAEGGGGELLMPQAGDFVAVRVTEALSANTLRAQPLALSSIAQYAQAERAGHAGFW